MAKFQVTQYNDYYISFTAGWQQNNRTRSRYDILHAQCSGHAANSVIFWSFLSIMYAIISHLFHWHFADA